MMSRLRRRRNVLESTIIKYLTFSTNKLKRLKEIEKEFLKRHYNIMTTTTLHTTYAMNDR